MPETLYVTCVTEEDAERALECLKAALPKMEMVYVGDVVQHPGGEMVPREMLGALWTVVSRDDAGRVVEKPL